MQSARVGPPRSWERTGNGPSRMMSLLKWSFRSWYAPNRRASRRAFARRSICISSTRSASRSPSCTPRARRSELSELPRADRQGGRRAERQGGGRREGGVAGRRLVVLGRDGKRRVGYHCCTVNQRSCPTAKDRLRNRRTAYGQAKPEIASRWQEHNGRQRTHGCNRRPEKCNVDGEVYEYLWTTRLVRYHRAEDDFVVDIDKVRCRKLNSKQRGPRVIDCQHYFSLGGRLGGASAVSHLGRRAPCLQKLVLRLALLRGSSEKKWQNCKKVASWDRRAHSPRHHD